MNVFELRIPANRFVDNTPEVYCDLYLFKTCRNLNRWRKRHNTTYTTPACAAVTTLKCTDKSYVSTFLFAKEDLTRDTIVHECVHMAHRYLEKIGKSHDEELLCYVTGWLADATLKARLKLMKMI
jgi:hypothetical protein